MKYMTCCTLYVFFFFRWLLMLCIAGRFVDYFSFIYTNIYRSKNVYRFFTPFTVKYLNYNNFCTAGSHCISQIFTILPRNTIILCVQINTNNLFVTPAMCLNLSRDEFTVLLVFTYNGMKLQLFNLYLYI